MRGGDNITEETRSLTYWAKHRRGGVRWELMSPIKMVTKDARRAKLALVQGRA